MRKIIVNNTLVAFCFLLSLACPSLVNGGGPDESEFSVGLPKKIACKCIPPSLKTVVIEYTTYYVVSSTCEKARRCSKKNCVIGSTIIKRRKGGYVSHIGPKFYKMCSKDRG